MNRPTPPIRRWLLPVLLVLGAMFVLAGTVRAAEVIPSKPGRYFNDTAFTVKPETADRLNRELEDYEKETSNQVIVCIYPKMQTDSDIADYCQRVARSWGWGQKDKRNGVVFFVFLEDHKTNIQVGYGLEGVLPDATCQQILANEVKPRFRTNDYDGGMTAGVESIIKATRGEYKGDGRTDYQRTHATSSSGGPSFGTIFFLIILAIIIFSSFRRRGSGIGGGMMGPVIFGGPSFGGGFGSSSSSDSGGSSSSSSDSGGFADSGGGDFGGGGASGDW